MTKRNYNKYFEFLNLVEIKLRKKKKAGKKLTATETYIGKKIRTIFSMMQVLDKSLLNIIAHKTLDIKVNKLDK